MVKLILKFKKGKADKIIGKPGMPHGMKDSDGDGVKNILDCKPYDKTQQGMIHRLAARAAEKVGAKGTAEYIKEREVVYDQKKAREEDIKRDADKAETESYYEKKKEVSIAKARERGASRAEGKGGMKGFAMNFIDQPNKTGAVTSRLKTTTKRVKIKSGKRKGQFKTIKVKTRVPVQQQQSKGIPNIFGSSSSGNSTQIPNLFGGNKGKEKEYKIPKLF